MLVRFVTADRHLQAERWSIVRGTVVKDVRQFSTTGLRRPDGALIQAGNS